MSKKFHHHCTTLYFLCFFCFLEDKWFKNLFSSKNSEEIRMYFKMYNNNNIYCMNVLFIKDGASS